MVKLKDGIKEDRTERIIIFLNFWYVMKKRKFLYEFSFIAILLEKKAKDEKVWMTFYLFESYKL